MTLDWTRAVLPLAAATAATLVGVSVLRRRKMNQRRRRVYIMRHGVKQENVLTRDNFTTELVGEGLAALAALRLYLDAHGVAFRTVLSSPFLRCRQTAAALAPRHLVEPGLSEVLSEKCGLRDGSGLDLLQHPDAVPAALARIRRLIEAVVDEHGGGSPVLSVAELEKDDKGNVSSMRRAVRLACRLRQRSADAFPMLLVTHGCASYGLLRAFLGDALPLWNHDLCPPMGAISCLEEDDAGTWHVVGSVRAARDDGGNWECRWTAGQAAAGADPAQL
eukprot:TRINITY_DN29610_c0_g1_i1.p1 TRINITY_DN29610_c0_g1~~TRINITY_DN29610_c0_g1_i1.p1  ORF type:complete len:312 (+),score=60.27 TRINITY_DN29610_c0_g1_i1:108-938(+)